MNNVNGQSSCGCHCCWCKVSFSFGLTAGLFVFVLGLCGVYGGHGLKLIESMGIMYPGFDLTLYGCFLGGFWAFLHVFVFFLIAGGIYRILSKCCNKCCCNKSCNVSCDSDDKALKGKK